MASPHSLRWRKPGRRNAEREKFRRLMQEVEAVRVRVGITKTKPAAALGTTANGLRPWTTGQTIGRKESVAKIEAFLKRIKTAKGSGTVLR
jgi:DNA-binding transcriptional regulator YiaG